MMLINEIADGVINLLVYCH